MKNLIKTTAVVGCLFFIQFQANAQWVSGTGGALHYTGGNIGIGTTSPHDKLEVYGGNILIQRGGELNFSWEGDKRAGIAATNTSPYNELQFFTGAYIEKMRIDANGNVGIGTTSPDVKLDVAGNIRGSAEFQAIHTNPGFWFKETDTVDKDWHVQVNSGLFKILEVNEARSQWDTRFVIEPSSGYIGIGTTDPNYNFEVERSNASNNTEYLLGAFNHSGNGGGVYLGYQGDGTDAKEARVRAGGNVDLALGTTAFKQAIFIQNSTGNVGIGTKNPGDKLVVEDVSQDQLSLVNSTSNSWQFRVGATTDLIIKDDGVERMRIDANGNVGIGTNDPQSKLAVAGTIRAMEVKVMADVNTVPDFVFKDDYDLATLEETEAYIEANGHLEAIPSAEEVGENGLDLGAMNLKLLQKVEELTLHLIEQNKQNNLQSKEIAELKARLAKLEK